MSGPVLWILGWRSFFPYLSFSIWLLFLFDVKFFFLDFRMWVFFHFTQPSMNWLKLYESLNFTMPGSVAHRNLLVCLREYWFLDSRKNWINFKDLIIGLDSNSIGKLFGQLCIRLSDGSLFECSLVC